jgi:hypothetical protein
MRAPARRSVLGGRGPSPATPPDPAHHVGQALPDQKTPHTVSQWTTVGGPAGAPNYESVLTLGEQSTSFDSMKVADLRPVAKPAAAS